MSSENPVETPKPVEKLTYNLILGSRASGLVTSFFTLKVDPGFNPAVMMNEIRGSGYFMSQDFSVWIPADMILGVARVVGEPPKDGKVLPFAVIPGGNTA